MNRGISRFIKISVLLLVSFSIITTILFFIFIARDRVVPILMYHSISNPGDKRWMLSLDREIFARQMRYLAKHNYKVVPLTRAVFMMRNGRDIPHNWVILTFDDEYADFYSQAYPIIKEYRFPATLFIYIYELGTNKKLSWQQLNQLQNGGLIDIGAHTFYHLPLVKLSLPQAKQEIISSKLILEEKLKKRVVLFAYPFGALNNSVEKLVRESGYEAAVGTAYRKGEFSNHDIFILKRIFVSGFSGYPFVFRFMLSGYYVPTRELVLRALNIRTPRDVWH